MPQLHVAAEKEQRESGAGQERSNLGDQQHLLAVEPVRDNSGPEPEQEGWYCADRDHRPKLGRVVIRQLEHQQRARDVLHPERKGMRRLTEPEQQVIAVGEGGKGALSGDGYGIAEAIIAVSGQLAVSRGAFGNDSRYRTSTWFTWAGIRARALKSGRAREAWWSQLVVSVPAKVWPEPPRDSPLRCRTGAG